jgi:hypothetical protein
MVLDKTASYLCSCCEATCSSAPARHSSPACPGLCYGTGRRRHQASTRAWQSASGPSRVVPPMLPPGALYRRTPRACQIFAEISPRHPATDNSCYLGTQHLWQIDYSRVPTTCLHPLLGLVRRLQVTRHRRRVNEVVRQEFDPTTTTCGGPGHRCRMDRLRILNFRRADDHFQV